MSALWRGLRYVLAVFAAFLVGGVVWISWLLSGHRYQAFLTEQLSALFDAHVQVERSQLSFHGGLGLQFDTVTIQDSGAAAPFFVAEKIGLLLDFHALWRGELLFDRIDFVRPRLQVELVGERLLQLIHRLRATRESTTPSSRWFTLGFTPTLAAQDLRLHEAEIIYTTMQKSVPFIFSGTEAVLVFSETATPTLTLRTTVKNTSGDIGQVVLRATTTKEITVETFRQSEWAGEIELADMQLQPLGQVLGERWPPMQFNLNGRFQGKRDGPVDLTGVVDARALQFGEVRLNEARLQILKARWNGLSSGSWVRACTLEAKIERLQGSVGKPVSPLVVTKGALTFHDDELTLEQLSGSYGKASQLIDARVSLRKLLAKEGPLLTAHLTADLDLGDDLLRLLTALTPPYSTAVSRILSSPHGRALAQFHIQQAGARSAPVYNGSVLFQHVGAQVLPWRLEFKDLNGQVQIDANTLSSDALTFSVGEAKIKAQGKVDDFLAPRRSGDLQFAFQDVRDYDLAPFLPTGKMLPQGGLVNGDLKVTLSASTATPQLTGRMSLSRIRLDLLDFLHPFEVVEGELRLSEHGGTFSVKQGQLPGGSFSGRGRIESWTPLRLELTGDFPDLDLASALMLGRPDDGLPKDATHDVKAELTANRLTYKSTQMEDLHLLCHWHGRQADLRVERAAIAGGKVEGDIILWPDIDAAYLAPRLSQLDVERFFRVVGVATKALSGSLSGEGKIYLPYWARWDDLDRWNAELSLAVEDGVAQRLPILVRLWSALSMQDLLRLQVPSLPTEGLPFSSLTGDFVLGEGIAVTNNLSLSGNSVRLDARGQIDLKRRALDLTTALVPLHGLTSSVAKVPLAGALLARGADYLTTLNFRVSGPYDDPSVTPLLY
ncbi:MAG: AsmA-like C-terminal domain-containing protein [Candidatus Binatia bacterium]